ncbi:MAG: hypothetical protein ACO294_12220 [Methylococcales bacterium]
MAKNINKAEAYKAAKPKENDYMINDGGGCFCLLVKTSLSHSGLFARLTKSRKNWHF